MTKKYISVTELNDSSGNCEVSQRLEPLPGGAIPNLLLNGGFNIWQRDTTFTATGYTADRWRADEATGAFTVSREAFTLGQTDVPGEPEFLLRFDMTTASGSGNPTLEQRVENVRTLAGQDATLSFYGRVSAGTIAVTPRFRQHFGTGGSPTPSADVDTDGSDITVTTAWQKFEATVSVPSVLSKQVGTNEDDYLSAMFVLPTSTFVLEVANVKLEAGGLATPFVPRPYGEELALCKRYFERRFADSGYWSFSLGWASGTGTWVTFLDYEVEKRAIPNIETSEASTFGVAQPGVGTTAITSISPNQRGTQSTQIQGNSSGLTASAPLVLQSNGTVAEILVDAEL